MGMYTQIRGWLNVLSIGDTSEFQSLSSKLRDLQENFLEERSVERPWVCNNTTIIQGSNGSVWLFIGVEYKNYNNCFDGWLNELLKEFPTAEGRIDYQYEESKWDDDGQSRYLLIRKGQIIKDDYCDTWCYGYGNGIK